MKVLLIDSYDVITIAQRELIAELYPDATIFRARTFQQATEKLVSEKVDLCVVDVLLTDLAGLRGIRKMRAIRPKMRILVFSIQSDTVYPMHYLISGVNGYLFKHATEEIFKKAVQTIIERGSYVDKSLRDDLIDYACHGRHSRKNLLASLTRREMEIFELLIRGRWAKEIANELNIAQSTVSTFKTRIFKKVKVTSVASLYQYGHFKTADCSQQY